MSWWGTYLLLLLGAVAVIMFLVWILPRLVRRDKVVRTARPPSRFPGPSPAVKESLAAVRRSPLPGPFADVERQVETMRQQVAAGMLTAEECETRLRDLMLEDADGNWWIVGFETGQWYRHDGTDWVQCAPPMEPMQR